MTLNNSNSVKEIERAMKPCNMRNISRDGVKDSIVLYTCMQNDRGAII